jgi:hypothetical protein
VAHGGDGAFSTVSGGGIRAGEGSVLCRGERRRSSPASLSSSALHRLFTTFLVSLAGGGEGTCEELGSKGFGSEGLGTEGSDSEGLGRGDGDFSCWGGGAAGVAAKGTNVATALASSVTVKRDSSSVDDGGIGKMEQRQRLVVIEGDKRAISPDDQQH